jgi:hypothetical protein
MAINANTCGILAVGLGIAGVVAYVAYSNVERTTIHDKEIPGATFNEYVDVCTMREFFRPEDVTENQVLGFTPHRYPIQIGGNINTLVHHGLSPLKKKAPMDNKWITRPPAEVMW